MDGCAVQAAVLCELASPVITVSASQGSVLDLNSTIFELACIPLGLASPAIVALSGEEHSTRDSRRSSAEKHVPWTQIS
jgi:hypothetical protein